MLRKKIVLITGASRGIGYATASYLAGKKNHILAVARSAESLEELKSSHSKRIDYVACDLLDAASIQDIIGYIRDNNVRISALIHNAGGLINKPFRELSDDDWNTMWNMNVLSAVRLLRALLPFFHKNAHIVTIGSMGGFQGSSKFPGLSAYSTSKGALSIWSECMATELKNEGISVNCLCLGAVQTEMLKAAFPGVKAPVAPDEIAGFIGDFALDGHRFMNGKVLPVALGDP